MSKRKPVNLEQAQKIANFWLNETGGNAEEALLLAAMSGGLKIVEPYTPPAPRGRPRKYDKTDFPRALLDTYAIGLGLIQKGEKPTVKNAFKAAFKAGEVFWPGAPPLWMQAFPDRYPRWADRYRVWRRYIPLYAPDWPPQWDESDRIDDAATLCARDLSKRTRGLSLSPQEKRLLVRLSSPRRALPQK